VRANLSLADRAVRVVAGAALVVAGLLLVEGVFVAAPVLVGALLIFSGSVGFCHVYEFLGFTMRRPR